MIAKIFTLAALCTLLQGCHNTDINKGKRIPFSTHAFHKVQRDLQFCDMVISNQNNHERFWSGFAQPLTQQKKWSIKYKSHYIVTPRVIPYAGGFFIQKPSGTVCKIAYEANKLLWETDLNTKYDMGGDGIAFNPAQKRLYVNAENKTYALDAISGKILWYTQHALWTRSAPLACGNMIYVVTADNTVKALSETDGTCIWAYKGLSEKTSAFAFSPPSLQGNRLVVCFSTGEMCALDSKTGISIWSENPSVSAGQHDGVYPPLIDEERIYITTYSGQTFCLHRETGKEIWSYNTGKIAEPLCTNTALFMISAEGNVMALDKYTGSMLWHHKLSTNEKGKKQKQWQGMVMINQTLCCISNDGTIVQLEPLKKACQKHVVCHNIQCIAPPVLTEKGYLLLTEEGAIHQINPTATEKAR